jgi:predicted esterase
MQTIRPFHHLFAVASILCPLLPAQGADEENLPAAEDLRAGGDDTMRYFLVGPRTDAVKKKAPKDGFKLLLVLPGGNGSAEFATFGRRIAANATDEQWLVAILVAPVWNEKQAKELVWPTRMNKADGMKFATEDFIAAVLRDVEQRHPVDPATVFTLTWSSSGPAAYATSLDPKIGVTGSFVAMSVWKPDQLPKLDKAKGHAYWLLHSPQDSIPIDMPKKAVIALKKAGASVEMAEYEGGHGWHGDVYGMMKTGLDWLVAHHAEPDAMRLAERKKSKGKPSGGDKDKDKDGAGK